MGHQRSSLSTEANVRKGSRAALRTGYQAYDLYRWMKSDAWYPCWGSAWGGEPTFVTAMLKER